MGSVDFCPFHPELVAIYTVVYGTIVFVHVPQVSAVNSSDACRAIDENHHYRGLLHHTFAYVVICGYARVVV